MADSIQLELLQLKLAQSPITSLFTGLALLLVTLAIFLNREAYRTDFPKVPGVPEVQDARAFTGNLHSLGGRQKMNDATVWANWATQLKSGIIQFKMGDRRRLVVSTWDIMTELWVKNNNGLLERPTQAGLSDKIGIDISSMPFGPQFRKCRQAGLKALGKAMWPNYYSLIEPNAVRMHKILYKEGKNGKQVMDSYPLLKQAIMDLTLAITYGARMDEFTSQFANGLLGSIHAVTMARSDTIAARPFVRLLRMLPQSSSAVIRAEKVRRKHIDAMYNQYLRKVADGNTPTCIVSSLSADKLTLDELHGTCVSLLQAAPDTIASGIYQCCAWLCSPEGQPFQKVALKGILDTYNGDRDEAWRMSFREEKVPLIVSLYKETLRFFATAPFSGRKATKDIDYHGTNIPKGIAVVMNIQALNHDLTHYGDDAHTFNPRRFMDNDSPSPHMSYGVGGRICPAYQISNRIIYAMLTRILLAFELKQVDGTRLPNTDMLDFSEAYGLVAFPRGYDCSFTARQEAWLQQKLEEGSDKSEQSPYICKL